DQKNVAHMVLPQNLKYQNQMPQLIQINQNNDQKIVETNQLNDYEMDLPDEQSTDDFILNDNISKYMKTHVQQSVGFTRKLNYEAYGKKSQIQNKIDQIYSTLDQKAQLQTQFKSLAQYERKVNIPILNNYGEGIQFISWNENSNQFELNEYAIDLFKRNQNEQKNTKISFVTIIGEQKSGKSFLLDQILEIPANKQRLCNTQKNPGLIIWSEPIYNSHEDCEIYFLDTQIDLKSNSHRQQQLFMLICLLSSTILMNIKSNNLKSQDFDTLKSLMHLQEQFEFDNLEHKEDLKYLFPKLMILMRDFTHEIKHKGTTVSGQQYLEQFLFDELQFQRATAEQQKLRRRIIKYFQNRNLFTMVNPIKNKNNENLNQLSFQDFCEEFQQEIQTLRKKIILESSSVKEFRGLRLSKNMVVEYIRSFIEDANCNEKFQIEKAFCILLENEFISVYHNCIEIYKKEMEQQFGDCEYMSLEQMNESLKKARDQVFFSFFKLKAHDIDVAVPLFDKYYKSINEFIKEMEDKFHQINNEETQNAVNLIMEEKIREVKEKTNNNQQTKEDCFFIKQQFEKILNEIKTICLGKQTNYAEVYGNHISQIQKYMLDVLYEQIQMLQNLNQEQLKEIKVQIEQKNKQLKYLIIKRTSQ
ncbi:hypothetical protein IMG5_100240, partial [Ichthyophthirius multifiliis]